MTKIINEPTIFDPLPVGTIANNITKRFSVQKIFHKTSHNLKVNSRLKFCHSQRDFKNRLS